MKNECYITAISPVYKAESLVEPLVERLSKALLNINPNFEIILVEDASPDNSWSEINRVASLYPNVKGIRLSRNFGQQYALQAGLENSSGEFIVTLDCDLQDPPEEIIKLYCEIQKGFDVVVASRENRKDNIIKRTLSFLFYMVLQYLTETSQDRSVANFVLYRRNVIDALAQMQDYRRYYPIMVHWVGFNLSKVLITHHNRENGSSSYSFKKRLTLAFNTIVYYSDKVLRLTVKLGVCISLFSLIIGFILFYLYINEFVAIQGWTSLAILISFYSGIIIAILGVVGLYVGKTFETVKRRPTYIIRETTF